MDKGPHHLPAHQNHQVASESLSLLMPLARCSLICSFSLLLGSFLTQIASGAPTALLAVLFPSGFHMASRMLFPRHACVFCSRRSVCPPLPCSVPGSWPLWASSPSGFPLGLADERLVGGGDRRELPLESWQCLCSLGLLSSQLWHLQ